MLQMKDATPFKTSILIKCCYFLVAWKECYRQLGTMEPCELAALAVAAVKLQLEVSPGQVMAHAAAAAEAAGQLTDKDLGDVIWGLVMLRVSPSDAGIARVMENAQSRLTTAGLSRPVFH
jgi:hypothetical protein